MPTAGPLHIRYAADASRLYIAFEGCATHRVSLATEHLTQDFLASRTQNPTIVLDLDDCKWLDSTFAGWMIRLQQEVKRSGGRVVISRCPASCRSSLETLGLTSLFDFAAVPPPVETKQITCADPAESDTEMIAFMLHSHEDLAHLNPRNERVFLPIAESLRRELRKQS